MTKEQEETLDWLLDKSIRAAVTMIGAYVVGYFFTKGVIKATGKNLRGFAVYKIKGK